jgi:tetratricopeptide (TPR) repeat protein
VHEGVRDAVDDEPDQSEAASSESPPQASGSRITTPLLGRRLRTNAAIAAALVALVFVTFFNALSGEFVQDDIPQITEAPMPGGFTSDNLRRVFSRDFWANIEPDKAIDKTDSLYYRPVFLVALMAGQKAAGTNARRWHAIAITLHALAALLVFFAVEMSIGSMAGSGAGSHSQALAGIAAAIFAVHPAQSESVAWISGLVGPLSTAFMIAAFICYISYRTKDSRSALIGMAVLFAVAALTKENTLALLLIVAACELVVFSSQAEHKTGASRTLVLVSLVGVAALYMLARYQALGFFFGRNLNLNFPDDGLIGTGDVIRTIPALVVEYGRLLVFPKSLSFMYGFGYVRDLSFVRFWLPLFEILLVVVLLVWWARRVPTARLGLIFLILPLLPHLNTRAFVSDEIVHDRYVYVSLVGLGILVGTAVVTLFKGSALRTTAGCLLTGLLMILTIRQNAQWKSAETLWMRAGQTAPNSRLVHIALGALAEGRRDAVSALAEYETALQINPDVIDALNNAAFTSGRTGDWRAATARFERIAGLTPNKAVAHFNLSFSYAVLRRYDDAVREQQRAIDLDPDGPRAPEWRDRLADLQRARDAARDKHARPE